jgi:RNA polymerase sigma factor (sigma-70 family)
VTRRYRAARSQDEDRFVSFYRAEYPPTVRLAFVLTSSSEIAEDVTQEAFARVHSRFDKLENPAAYLRVTTVNLTRGVHRQRQSERRHLATAPRPVIAADLGARELLDVLAELPERYRTVLVLRYWADWSEADIAAALRCRPGTVKSLASRALAKLKKELQP